MREVYGEEVAQHLEDREWIMRCAQEGWIIFSKDKGLRDKATKEFGYVRRRKARVFLIPAGLREEEQIARYDKAKYRIAMRAKKPGPMIYRCQPGGELELDYKPKV